MRAKTRPCAAKLAQVLGRAGHDVWWDRRLDGGEEFSAEIEAALDKSDVVLVAWSQDSVRSRWVRDEASYGCDKHILVPVSIDGSQPPMGFRQFHTLDLTGWKAAKRDERTSELLRSVERRLLGQRKACPDSERAETQGAASLLLRGKRRLWAAAMIFMLILAIGAALLFKNAI